jgi:DNA-directed RNA polymerase specialized sigma24 family protein
MTKNEIIAALYNSKEVDELILKIQPSYLRDDLKQYVFHVLCEKPDAFIINLSESKTLKYFLVRIITNSVFSNSSGFLSIHRKSKEVYQDQFKDVEDVESNHELIDRCEKEVEKLYWYNKELLELYAEHGTYRAVSEFTDIPVKSVHNAVKKAKLEIRKRLWK